MPGHGIDVRVNGGWLDSFGYELSAEEGLAWTGFLNQHLIEGARGGKNFAPRVGSVSEWREGGTPFGGIDGRGFGRREDRHAALRQSRLPRCSGLRSILGGGFPPWSSRFIHPMYGCVDDRLLDCDMINAVCRGRDSLMALARMLCVVHFTKYAGMSVVLLHGGWHAALDAGASVA